MKQGRTLSDLAAEIERQASAKADYIAPTAAMTLRSPGGVSHLDLGRQGEFTVGDLAHAHLADHTGVPKLYYDRLRESAPALLDANVNHWLHTNSSKRMVRVLDGSARAFLSDRYRRLDNIDLMQSVLPTLHDIPELQIASCEITEKRLYLKVTTPRIGGDVKVGDTVQAGLVISNSEVGCGAVSVQPMSIRLVCLNGAVHTDFGSRKSHVAGRGIGGDGEEARRLFTDEALAADDKAFFLKVRDIVKGSLTQETFDSILDQMREAAGAKLEGDPTEAVEVLANRYRLTEGEKGGVLRALIEGADLSMWGVANAVTHLSQHVGDYDRATELEQLGGTLLSSVGEWKMLTEAGRN